MYPCVPFGLSPVIEISVQEVVSEFWVHGKHRKNVRGARRWLMSILILVIAGALVQLDFNSSVDGLRSQERVGQDSWILLSLPQF